MFTLFLFTLLLSNIGHSFAFNVTAHSGARSKNATTTLIQQKRQNGVIVTRLSTVFLSGDPTRTRTANPGFDCRIDLSAKLWGFCPTTVIAASDCGLAGSCVDNHGCSKGCGFTNQDLTTFTCKDPGNDYCSTALLTLSNRDLGAFSYIACGKAPITDSYLTFTTTVELPFDAQVTSTSTTGRPISTSKIAPETSTSTSTSTSASPSSANAVPSTSGSASEGANDNNNSSSSSNGGERGRGDSGSNIGAIVGGVVGSLTVLCGSVVAIVWLLRRNRKEKALASSSSSQAERDMIDQTGSGGDSGGATGLTSNEIKYPDIYGSERMAPTYSVQELEHNEYRGGWKPPQELAGVRSPREMADTWVRSMPVELPAGSVYWKRNSGHGNGNGNGGMI